MKFSISQIKIALVVAAVIIAAASLVVSHILVRDLAIEERNRMEVWAEAMRSLSMADENTDLNLVLKVIEENKTIEHVLLKFTPNRLPYVLSKPLHSSQKIENRREGIISINVIPNKELVSELIWFGSDVEVLAPDSLREKIKQKIAEMHKKYFDVKNDFTTAL